MQTAESLALDCKIEELWLSGLTSGQIANKLKLTRLAVIGRVYRMGLTADRNPNLQEIRGARATRIKNLRTRRRQIQKLLTRNQKWLEEIELELKELTCTSSK